MITEAHAISVVSKPGEPTRIVLLDLAGNAIGQATLRPQTFEKIFDRIGQAMALSDAQGLGELAETWVLDA